MPIVNINTLQSNVSNSDYMTTYTDVYLKQSLANLGQRFNVKGDGITSDSFAVSDVFNEYLGEFTSSHLVKISYNYTDGDINMHLCTYSDGNINTLKNVGTTVPIDYVNSVVTITDDFTLESQNSIINNTDHYKSGATILKSDNWYITSAIGMSNNADTGKEVMQEYVCDKISVTGELIEGLRIIKANDYANIESDEQSLRMIHIWNNVSSDNTKSGYVIDVYKPNYSEIEGYNTIENYVYDVIVPLCESSTQKTFISPSYIKNVLAPYDNNSDDFYGWSIVKRYSEGNLLTTSMPYVPNSVTYNSTDNQYWKVSEAYSKLDLDEKDVTFDINNVINYFAADVTTWLDTIKKKYQQLLYTSTSSDINLKLKQQIFGSLIKKLFVDWINQDATVTENINVYNIYLPYDYRIYYNCNDNDTSIIYNSNKNLTVKFEANIFDRIYDIIGDAHEQCIIADTSENKVGIYNFTITYLDNTNNSVIIDSINFDCQYVLPFVNDNGYWCINDEKTDIFALGVDAGNPNIVLSYSSDTTYSIISAVDKDILQTWEWERTPVKIEPLDRDNNLGDGFYYELNAYMPSTNTLNNLSPSEFSKISNALFVNFLSPNTETYPELYSTTYLVDPSKIIYNDITYDQTTAKYVKYSYSHYNDDIISRTFAYSGGYKLTPQQMTQVIDTPYIVTSNSGDGNMSQLYGSITYRDNYDISHEAWQFSYQYTYKVVYVQRNWLRNREFTYVGAGLDAKNDGAYFENGVQKYYYDKVFYEENLTYSYWWPLQYTADYTYAYISNVSINEDSLLYKLGGNGVITTLWSLTKNEEDNSYEWTYIKKPNSYFALDTNYINNLDNNIRYYLNNEYQPDNYEHRWIMFEKANRLLKNNTTDEHSYIYPIIQNKNRDNYINIFGEQSDTNISNVNEEVYNNDLNFEIAFYNNIKKNNVGSVTNDGITQNDNRFWKGTAYSFDKLCITSDDDIESNTYGMLLFTNSSTIAYADYNGEHQPILSYTGVDSLIHYSLYPNEWVPNGKYNTDTDEYSYQFPTLELKEVLLRDVNTINRLNILSFDHHENTGNASYMIYNAYFGTSYETPDKNILIVGTSYRNINLGTETFTTYESTYNLAPHNILQLNVDNVELNGYTNANKDIIANEAIWKKVDKYIPWTGETLHFYSTIVQPSDIAYYLGIDTEHITPYRDGNIYESTCEISDNNSYDAVLSYNNYLLSYLNRAKHTQTRYFSKYMRDNDEINVTYVQTLSYLNVNKLLADYCSIETDCGSYIYGDAQALFNINTWDQHTTYEFTDENGVNHLCTKDSEGNTIDNLTYDSEFYDINASRYAQEHSKNTYYMLLSTNLSSDENLLFTYTSQQYTVDNEGNAAYTVDEDNKPVYNTYRYVTTNPIAITYTNCSYSNSMEYETSKYVYSFTYATSYFMEYQCPGCSLCSSSTCKYIEHCKWSEIVGYFNVGTCWMPIDRKNQTYQYQEVNNNVVTTRNDGDGKEYIENLYRDLISYSYITETGLTYTDPKKFESSYMLTATYYSSSKFVKDWYTYDVRKISYNCWSYNDNDTRFKTYDKPSTFAKYNVITGLYLPEVHFFEDPNAVDSNGKPLLDAKGNPLRVAYITSFIEPLAYTGRYAVSYETGKINKDDTVDYTIYNGHYFNANQQNGSVVTVANAYYCHVPVSYFDSVRNLRDTYLMTTVSNTSNPYGVYLWANAPERYLHKENNKYVPIYYKTEERNITYTGTYSETPNLLVAKYTPTFAPINNYTKNRRGWDLTYVTNVYGERIQGSHYNSLYDENKNGYIDANDLNIYKSKVNAHMPGYSEDEIKKIEEIIRLNNDETTYTCYFTYLGSFPTTGTSNLTYKCINIREIVTPHTVPYYNNGNLLSTNMMYKSVVDKYTESWNFDSESRTDNKNELQISTYCTTYEYNDINNNTVRKTIVTPINIHTVKNQPT